MYKRVLIILSFLFITPVVHAQKWQPGSFTDMKGNKVTGLIRENPSGKAPIRDEGFIEFKDNSKSNPYKLSASDIKSFIVGQDSFVVAHAPRNENWSKRELDFVKVALNEDVRLYVAKVKTGSGSGIGVSPEFGGGIGTGGYSGAGGGIAINLGGGGGKIRTTWYYGANTAEMQQLTPINFKDIMSDIMGDEPDVVEKIQAGQFNLASIDKLIAYFKQVKASHK
ncbi:MAG: hypothetical protein JWP37_1040 [Mucilaginibacter sp.]|nr:hypothetical protein [Mucilaginibacter sp.]